MLFLSITRCKQDLCGSGGEIIAFGSFSGAEGSGDVPTSYTFNGDLLTGDGTDSVSWDDNGRQTSQLSSDPNNYKVEYDWDGQLRKGQNGSSSRTMEAKYTPDGARIAKKRIWDDASSYNHKYIVDTVGEVPAILLVLDANDNNAILKSYVHANDEVIMQHAGKYDQARYFYLHDRLGSVRQVIDSSALVVNCYTYDPWGLTAGDETSETVSNLYRFADHGGGG